MQKKNPFNFEYTYLSLPDKFYSIVQPSLATTSKIFLLNRTLCHELDVLKEKPIDLLHSLLGESSNKNTTTFAQAYAGHQFGHFTMLGDGRAIMLGEHVKKNKQRFDIQLKGSGRTPYSRGGDGKATLKAMLREYLMSETMHHLNIPSSRSLALLKTGEPVYRKTQENGAALVRVMKSHIRVGTFEYAVRFGSIDDVKALIQYTIKRLYPSIEKDENPALSLLHQVIRSQIDLVANWMRVGFIHGVMNTDNTSISGETFDYGPCAFMNNYDSNTVYSSIDHQGRYAYGNQPNIIKWNIVRLAETLLPILHTDKEKSLALAQSAIDDFDAIWKEKYYGIMLKKLGIETNDAIYYELVDELLEVMSKLKMDYTNTFKDLSQKVVSKDSPIHHAHFKSWLEKWENTIDQSFDWKTARALMSQYNPMVIPRNHIVEQALDDAANEDTILYDRLLQIISKPYQYQDGVDEFLKPPDTIFESNYQTFCGT